MPANLFLHFLRHPRGDSRDGHLGDTWLQRLPKKLNAGILDEVRRSTRNPGANAQLAQESEEDDIVFGWGVHILEGPNQAGLSLILAFWDCYCVPCIRSGGRVLQDAGARIRSWPVPDCHRGLRHGGDLLCIGGPLKVE